MRALVSAALLTIASASHAGESIEIVPLTAGSFAGNAVPMLQATPLEHLATYGRQLGLDVVADPETPARYVLHGEVIGTRCAVQLDPVPCEVHVRWDLLDTARATTAYRVEVHTLATAPLGGISATRDAVYLNLADVLRRPVLRALVETPPPAATPAPAAGSTIASCRTSPKALPAGTPAAMTAAVEVVRGNVRGMGAFVSPDGFVLTALHVVNASADPTITVRRHDGTELTARVVRTAPGADAALLSVESTGQPCLVVGEGAGTVGENTWVLGAPRGDEAFSLMRGIVSATRKVDAVTVVQTDAAINPGDSGGPVLSDDGRMRAVASFKIAGTAFEGLGYAVSATDALRLLGVAFGNTTTLPKQSVVEAIDTPAERVDTPTPSTYDAYVAEHGTGRRRK